jgi:hypothetical protein
MPRGAGGEVDLPLAAARRMMLDGPGSPDAPAMLVGATVIVATSLARLRPGCVALRKMSDMLAMTSRRPRDMCPFASFTRRPHWTPQ